MLYDASGLACSAPACRLSSAWTRKSRSLHSLHSARRRALSTSRAKASFFFVSAKAPPRRRYRLARLVNRGSSTLRVVCASSTRLVSAELRGARGVAIRGGGHDDESNGGEHAYDSGALLKGRRVNGGARGRSRDGLRDMYAESRAPRRHRRVLLFRRDFAEQFGLSAKSLEGSIIG